MASVERFRNILKQLTPIADLRVGDVVRWKDGFRNKRSPQYGELIVVSRVYDVPLYDTSGGGGSPYFNEPLDFCAIIVDSDGDIVEYHFDSRRFEKVEV